MKYLNQLPQKEQRHCRRVAAVSKLVAESMDLSLPEVSAIEEAALLHDVGKAMVPLQLLTKPGRLSANEQTVMLSHTILGKRMLGGGTHMLSTASIVALQHHEYLDGSGYLGLTDKAIHPHAKLVTVADMFDKLAFCRAGPEEENLDYACGVLRQTAGTKLDEQAVHSLLSLLGQALATCHMADVNAYSAANAHC